MPSRCVPLSFFQNIIESAQLTNWISSLMPFLDPCSLPAPTERKVLQMKFPRAADVQSCWFGVIHFPIFCSQDRLPAGRDLTVLQLRSGNLPTSCTLLFSSLNRREIRDEGGCPSLSLSLSLSLSVPSPPAIIHSCIASVSDPESYLLSFSSSSPSSLLCTCQVCHWKREMMASSQNRSFTQKFGRVA